LTKNLLENRITNS